MIYMINLDSDRTVRIILLGDLTVGLAIKFTYNYSNRTNLEAGDKNNLKAEDKCKLYSVAGNRRRLPLPPGEEAALPAEGDNIPWLRRYAQMNSQCPVSTPEYKPSVQMDDNTQQAAAAAAAEGNS